MPERSAPGRRTAGAGRSPFRAAQDGLRVRVRLTPRAADDRIDGLALEADGSTAIKVAVTAPPADGRANAALIRFLAAAWRLPRSRISLVAGAADRRKTLHVAGEPEALRGRLEAWLAGLAARR